MRLKWAVVVVALCVVVTVAAVAYAAGKASDVPEVIRAQRFELVDEEGTVHAALGLGRRVEAGAGGDGLLGGRPVLEMYDPDGRTRVQLFAGRRGPGLDLLHKTGWKPGVAVRVDKGIEEGDGHGNLVLTYEGDGTRAGVHVNEGGARLELRDHDGRTVWSRP
jgi:hypothetical protein